MIEEHKFGSFVINGKTFLGDIKIVGSKVRYWNNREKHNLQVKDIEELLESNPEVIIIGTGNSGLLTINQEVKNIIANKRIELLIGLNTNAISKYNELIKANRRVAAIFHGTC